MNKSELVTAVAERSGLTKTDSEKAINAFIDAVRDGLVAGDEVRLVGFGTFAVSDRAATTGRNPRTGEAMNIPASKQPKFRAGKDLKDAVNA